MLQDAGLGEDRAGGVRLERLDEAGFQRVLDIGVDGEGAGLEDAALGVVGRAKDRAERKVGEPAISIRRAAPSGARVAATVLVVPKSTPMAAVMIRRPCGKGRLLTTESGRVARQRLRDRYVTRGHRRG
jgi:hypothetical protein